MILIHEFHVLEFWIEMILQRHLCSGKKDLKNSVLNQLPGGLIAQLESIAPAMHRSVLKSPFRPEFVRPFL